MSNGFDFKKMRESIFKKMKRKSRKGLATMPGVYDDLPPPRPAGDDSTYLRPKDCPATHDGVTASGTALNGVGDGAGSDAGSSGIPTLPPPPPKPMSDAAANADVRASKASVSFAGVIVKQPAVAKKPAKLYKTQPSSPTQPRDSRHIVHENEFGDTIEYAISKKDSSPERRQINPDKRVDILSTNERIHDTAEDSDVYLTPSVRFKSKAKSTDETTEFARYARHIDVAPTVDPYYTDTSSVGDRTSGQLDKFEMSSKRHNAHSVSKTEFSPHKQTGYPSKVNNGNRAVAASGRKITGVQTMREYWTSNRHRDVDRSVQINPLVSPEAFYEPDDTATTNNTGLEPVVQSQLSQNSDRVVVKDISPTSPTGRAPAGTHWQNKSVHYPPSDRIMSESQSFQNSNSVGVTNKSPTSHTNRTDMHWQNIPEEDQPSLQPFANNELNPAQIAIQPRKYYEEEQTTASAKVQAVQSANPAYSRQYSFETGKTQIAPEVHTSSDNLRSVYFHSGGQQPLADRPLHVQSPIKKGVSYDASPNMTSGSYQMTSTQTVNDDVFNRQPESRTNRSVSYDTPHMTNNSYHVTSTQTVNNDDFNDDSVSISPSVRVGHAPVKSRGTTVESTTFLSPSTHTQMKTRGTSVGFEPDLNEVVPTRHDNSRLRHEDDDDFDDGVSRVHYVPKRDHKRHQRITIETYREVSTQTDEAMFNQSRQAFHSSNNVTMDNYVHPRKQLFSVNNQAMDNNVQPHNPGYSRSKTYSHAVRERSRLPELWKSGSGDGNDSGLDSKRVSKEWYKNEDAPNLWDPDKMLNMFAHELERKAKVGDTQVTELRVEFDPKKFLEYVPKEDSSGVPFAAWKRLVMAKQMAEKAQLDHDRRNMKSEQEMRLENMPLWKRVIVQRTQAERI